MFSVKSFFITGVSLSVIMLSSCVSEQKSTASSNTTPDSTALIENNDWSVYMKAPEYHFELAQKHLQKGDVANASIQLKRGNSFLIFQKNRLAAISKKIEDLSVSLKTGNDRDSSKLDSLIFAATNVIKNKFAMLPYEIFADSFFHESYKYHYRQAKWRLHRNDFAGAAYEIRSAGSYLNLIVVNWPDTSKVKLESAGNRLKELAYSVESGTVKDTTELDLLVQKIVPTVTSDKK